MPEGHTIHRAARDQAKLLAGHQVSAWSPQGRFADGATEISGQVLDSIDAHGKHLFYRFGDGSVLHVHLGLFGRFMSYRGDAPEPRGAVRLRMSSPAGTVDLRGPTACELLDAESEERVLGRLGPDPLRTDADPERAWRRIQRSRRSIGALVMDQSVVAGIGNVFRAEALHVMRIHPTRRGCDVSRAEFDALWGVATRMLRDGVRSGRIVTVSAEVAGKPRSRLRRGETTYVYRQSACRTCGGPVDNWDLEGRRAWACPGCQA